MGQYSVTGFQMSYKALDLSLFKNNPRDYAIGLLCMEVKEFNRGFKAKRVNKATKKGTTVTYEAIQSEEDALKIREELLARDAELAKQTK